MGMTSQNPQSIVTVWTEVGGPGPSKQTGACHFSLPQRKGPVGGSSLAERLSRMRQVEFPEKNAQTSHAVTEA